MARNIPSAPPPLPDTSPEQTGYITRRYDISIVTPMFGGGVEAGVVDDKMPVRGTAIRGQLRFWWRATVGKRYGTAQELAKAENLIWGTTDKASPVKLAVKTLHEGITEPCAHFSERSSFPKAASGYPPYVIFPFQGKKGEQSPAKALKNHSFQLTITFPDALTDEIDTSLKAWVNFGGIGARTRKGCGSLFCPQLSPGTDSSLENWICDTFGNSISQDTPWPTLGNRILLGNVTSPESAWNQIINSYRTFRQGENVGRNPGQKRNHPGRSRWPEADSIRRLTGKHTHLHAPDPDKPEKSFPRAALGLPIITHFKDREDPNDTELYPFVHGERKTRMASPIILKPLAIAPDKAVPLVLLLDAPLPDGLELKDGREYLQGIENDAKILNPAAAAYPHSPMGENGKGKFRSEAGDAREAFLAYCKENGFREVTE